MVSDAKILVLPLVLGLMPAGAVADPPKPREFSEAERAAVELAAAYLHRGPEAWWERLAAGSPLRRLGREAALDEIAARVGPAAGVTWQLLTPGPSFDARTAVFGVELASGLDETLILRLVDEGGWKIVEIRTSVDPVRLGPRPRVLTAAVRPHPAEDPGGPASAPFPLWAAAALLLLGLAGGVAMLLLARAGQTSAAISAGAAVVVVGLVIALWGWVSASGSRPAAPRPAPRTVNADLGFLPLGELAPLRAALAAGTDRAEIERVLATPPEDPRLQEVADLWRAHSLLAEADLAAVDDILGRFPAPANHALAELLRARLAFRRLQQEDTGWFYEQAIARGLDHDGLRLESVLAKALTNEGDRAEAEITAMLEMGSRLGDAWYSAAQIALSRGQVEESEDLLRRAWRLEPAPREDLFDNPVLAYLVTRPKLFPLFQLGVPEEARPIPEGDPRPIALPAGARAATCGQALRLSIGDAEILVPGGAPFAPEGSTLEDAGAWSRHGEEKALAALPSLLGGSTRSEIFQPRRLRLAEQAARALTEQNRWSELLALTEPLEAEIQRAPASLIRLRAQALRRLERNEEARQLLIRLAGTDLANRRPTPGTLLDLSELFAASGEYDTAIKLSLKADSQLPEPRGARRRKQLEMDRDLAASFASHRSEHFEIRYPEATGERYAQGVAWVLEEERRRLLHWIPQPGRPKPIEVHLFPIRDFLENYGGDMGVVGLFDGKVRVPFAEIRSLHPQLIAILSHEVAHAMIAAATRDQAPHWFQEGLAQHIEMGTGRVNPLPDLARTKRALSFPTVDPILRGFAEPQLVDLAYSEAAWTVHFLEARFGVKAIHRLLAAFAAGRTTEQALREVCALSPADFDRALWTWGTDQAPATRVLAVRRYDVERDVKMAKEQTKQVKEVLRVGVSQQARDEMARREKEAEERRRQMAAWHAGYAARASEVKRALKPILDVYQKGGRGDTFPACVELASGAARMVDDPGLWSSPDREVNQKLQKAYQALGNLGQACKSGRDNEVRFLITEVDQALTEAARHLEPYGLTP